MCQHRLARAQGLTFVVLLSPKTGLVKGVQCRWGRDRTTHGKKDSYLIKAYRNILSPPLKNPWVSSTGHKKNLGTQTKGFTEFTDIHRKNYALAFISNTR